MYGQVRQVESPPNWERLWLAAMIFSIVKSTCSDGSDRSFIVICRNTRSSSTRQLVASGGRALSVINPEAIRLDEPLQSRNSNPLYDPEGMLCIGERLLKSEGAYW